MQLTMVTSNGTEKPMFFTRPQLAHESVITSCAKLELFEKLSVFPDTTYTYKNAEGAICSVINVHQIMDSEILDHVEHL